jgi:hypothetical protein
MKRSQEAGRQAQHGPSCSPLETSFIITGVSSFSRSGTTTAQPCALTISVWHYLSGRGGEQGLGGAVEEWIYRDVPDIM